MPTDFGRYISTGTCINHYGASGSIQIKSGEGILRGVFPSIADNTPTLAFFDAVTDATGTIVAPFTPSNGSIVYNFGDGIKFTTGLIAKATGSVLYTVLYE